MDAMRLDSANLDRQVMNFDCGDGLGDGDLHGADAWLAAEASIPLPALPEFSDGFGFGFGFGGANSPTGVLHSTVELPPPAGAPYGRDSGAAFGSDDGSSPLEGGSTPTAAARAGAPAGPRRARASAPAATEEERRERVRAKNRRAQGKYREKKKAQRSQTSEALDAIAADMERLRLENDRLAAGNQMMEQVLEVRDAVAAALERGQQEEAAAAQAGGKPPGSMQSILHRLQASAPPGRGDPGAGRSGEACLLTGLSLPEVAALKATSPELLAARFKALVDPLRAALKEVTDPAAAAPARAAAERAMQDLLFQAGCMCFEHSVHNPTAVQRLLAASLDEGDGGGGGGGWEDSGAAAAAVAARYAGITAELGLSPGQRAALQPLRGAYLERMGRVVGERRAVLARLQAVVPPATLRALRHVTTQWLDLHEASTDLAASLQEEHVACMEFVAKAFGGVLTPLQKAKALVLSFPQFPDVFAIATAAGDEARGPEEASVVAAAAAAAAGQDSCPLSGCPSGATCSDA